MRSIASLPVPPRLEALAALGLLLERLERQPRHVGADQYRDVVRRVTRLVADAEPGPELDRLLAALPATAELYENLHYAHAGLCRSALDPTLRAELAARDALAKAGRAGAADSTR